MVGRPGNDPGQCLDAGFTVQTPSLEVYRPLTLILTIIPLAYFVNYYNSSR